MGKTRMTCFFCKYAITELKHVKEITYANKTKIICRYCNKTKHKPLEPQYKLYETSCKICKKVVMNKDCIACSLCDQFSHGRCLNLTKIDIKNIENTDKNYFCPPCVSSILPLQVTNDKEYKVKKFKKANNKECMICCAKILNRKYTNKNIIYNGNEKFFCPSCSLKGLCNPVKNKDLLEFLDCSICTKPVKYQSIFCNQCQHWTHPTCNRINKKELHKLANSESNWYCLKCCPNKVTNPFCENSNPKEKLSSDEKFIDDFKTYDDCMICKKKVTGKHTLSCSTCCHWIHKNCIGNFGSRLEYSSFLKYYADKEWDCPSCKAETLPFIMMDQDEFFIELLDMFYKPTYVNRSNFKNVLSHL